ncbi:hypothetical protein J5N97_001519 [Dioscorea zingiberensis]|uniref:Uncharacterized protein n=1 Tax=Dioscorea zingiberensis TaxID=325984 RepID=A0A9D5BTN7_9LILI|nr:hypothetical protein J5N97_001519 [Dioscorea zingiberensis]
MASKQRPPSSDSSSSSEEEEQVLQHPPPRAKNPSLKSTSPKTKPSKSLQKPSYDEEDEDGEPPVSQKKDQKKKEVSVKKDEKKNEEEEEEGSNDEEDEKQQEEEDEDDDNDDGTGTSDEEKQQLSKKPDSMAISASGSDSCSEPEPEPSEKPAAVGIVTPAASGRKRPRGSAPSEPENTENKKPVMRIWEVKSKGKSALKVVKDQEQEGDPRYELMWRAFAQEGNGDISLSLLKRGLKLVDPEKARILERRFFKLEQARMRLRLKWLDKTKEAICLLVYVNWFQLATFCSNVLLWWHLACIERLLLLRVVAVKDDVEVAEVDAAIAKADAAEVKSEKADVAALLQVAAILDELC